MYRLATTCTGKKTSRSKREHEFFLTQTITHTLVYSALLTVHTAELKKIGIANFSRHAWVDWVWVRS